MKNPQLTIRVSISEAGTRSPFLKNAGGLGKGVVELCARVKQSGSLNQAAKEMGMAYSKAWRIIKEAEESLDISLLQRNGAKGSSLTDEGEKILTAYTQLQKDLEEYAEKRFFELLS